MLALRQLVFVALCAVLPFASLAEVSAQPPVPAPTVRFTMSRQSASITSYSGRTCSFSYPDYTFTADDEGAWAAYLVETCGDTRLLVYLIASTAWIDGSAMARVVGGADIYRYESGSWRLKRSAEIGKNWFYLPITDSRVTSTVGTGNGSGSFTYRITARRI